VRNQSSGTSDGAPLIQATLVSLSRKISLIPEEGSRQNQAQRGERTMILCVVFLESASGF